jgi:hypothetical protein
MARTICLVVNAGSVNGRCKNIGSESGHIYSPDQFTLSAELAFLFVLLALMFC